MQGKKRYDDYFEAAAAAKKERLRRAKVARLKQEWIQIAGLIVAIASLLYAILKESGVL